MKQPIFIPLAFEISSEDEILAAAQTIKTQMDSRRSVRYFSDRPVSKDVIEAIIMTASSAPSGAHKQPWTFCIVSDPQIKAKIRAAAEKGYERQNRDTR